MNTTQIRCFLEAARCLSFTEAAANLFISQPAFSRNISSLEDEWRIELFIRDNKHKRTRLTPAGAMVYEEIQKLWNQYGQLIEDARRIHEGKSGTLRIGILDSDRISEETLTAFDRFQTKYPGVDVSLRRGSYRELIQWLSDYTLDLAFTLKIDVAAKDWLLYESFYSLESVLILKSDHPLANSTDLSLYNFRNETFINVTSDESQALNALLAQECGKAGFVPRVIDAPDLKTQMLYLESGKGVAIGSVNNMAIFNNHIAMIRLIDLMPLDVVMAWNRSNYNPCISLFHSSYEPIE